MKRNVAIVALKLNAIDTGKKPFVNQILCIIHLLQ